MRIDLSPKSNRCRRLRVKRRVKRNRIKGKSSIKRDNTGKKKPDVSPNNKNKRLKFPKLPYFPLWELALDVPYWNDNRGLSYIWSHILRIHKGEKELFDDLIRYATDERYWHLLLAKMKRQEEEDEWIQRTLQTYYEWKKHQHKKEVEVIEKESLKASRKLVEISHVPTRIVRIKPFWLMSKRDMKKQRLKSPLVWEHPWGKITISQWKLSTYDEDVFLCLLRLYEQHKSEIIKTTRYRLCKMMGVYPAKSTYEAIWRSLRRLKQVNIELEYWDTQNKERKRIKRKLLGILQGAEEDEETGHLLIGLNLFFIQEYDKRRLTPYEFQFRRELRGDTTKALYLFLQTQSRFYGKGKYGRYLFDICKAINLGTEGKRPFELRKQIRKSLRELQMNDYLADWKISKKRKGDYIVLWKGDYDPFQEDEE
jgi:hypothetical protein